MNKNKIIEINNEIEKFSNDFWNIDCLIRILKEISSNKCMEIQEEDIYTICNLLIKESENSLKIKEIRKSFLQS